jgi:predicted alpha/beta hydrolase family esterase
MKKVFLVHCWGGTIEDGWYPWLKKELEKRNIKVIMENMPRTEEPTINEWVTKLDSLVDVLDKDTYFIGHSIGCQTILRYLETKDVTKIGSILLVAPWLDLLPLALEDGTDKIAYEWINKSINFLKLKNLLII